jgi:alkanesulfonate monooxygenase SsuD/methylene tetrahydromethanopterin reductase-like flavin-dependent oxidoreductase (luciferase family)
LSALARIGFALGYDGGVDTHEMARRMSEAEERGFEFGFFSETIELMRDSVSSVAAIGLRTSRLGLGATQIVRLRTPLVMAQTAASLDELTGGRFVLAPGACTKTHAKRHGLVPVRPHTALREWVEAIRLLLRGDLVSYSGEVVQLEDVRLGWTPTRTAIPMLIPATSRAGLELAAEIGDGVILNSVSSPEYSAAAVDVLRQAVAAAGRDWDRFEVAQIVSCSVEDEHTTAVDAIRWEVASKLDPYQLPYNARARLAIGEPYLRTEDFPSFQRAWDEGGKEGLARAVPVSYVEGMTASGTPDEVVERVARYRDAGVKLPIVRPARRHQAERLLDLFAPS